MELLISRLERLSADSIYAHQASGYRGALLRLLESGRTGGGSIEISESELDKLMGQAYLILHRAAREKLPRSFRQDIS